MSTVYQIFEIAATVIETAILLEFLNRLLGSKLKGLKNTIQFILAFVIINCYMIFSGFISIRYSAVLDFIGIALYVVYSLIFMKRNIIYRFITPILSIMIIFFLNIFVCIAVSYLLKSEPYELLIDRSSLRILLLFITKSLFFILTRIALKIAKPEEVLMNKRELTSVSVIFAISVVLLGFAAETYYDFTNGKIDKFMIVLLCGLAAINVTVFALFGIIAKKNRVNLKLSIMKTQFEEQKKSYDSVQTVYNNLQILQHDLKNEFLCLYNLIDNNQNEKAKEYITKFSDTNLNRFHEYIKTGNEILDAIINVKLNFAREKGINVICNINTDFCGFETDDIVRLFSNTIDNAIEVCLKQENSRINVSMENKRNYLSITISNTIISSVLENNSEMKTTKKDPLHHGFGTQSMKSITEKYDGMLEFYEKEGMFITDIMIKKSKEIPNTK